MKAETIILLDLLADIISDKIIEDYEKCNRVL